jgi:2-dehydropantoate 2-reductase
MVEIAVIGPGAIGGTLAAWLAELPGNDVSLCVRTPFERLVVEVPGGRSLEPDLGRRLATDDARPVDWVIAATKAYDTAGAREWVARLLGPETCLAVVQNGVEHAERFADVVPPKRTLPVMVDLSAERSAPGRIRQRHVGRIVVPDGELGLRFASLLAASPMEIVRTSDFTTEAWSKLALNSAGVVQALTGKPAGIVRNARAAALMHGIALETIRVGRAVGARLDDALADRILERFRAAKPDAGNSLLADRLAGQPLEIDARNGVVVRLGKAHGIATPLNEMAVAILEAATT